MDLAIDLQPKQSKLYRLMEHSDHTNIGYGGARGGGKSHGARSVILLRRIEHPKTPALIFRRTYGELLANHIDPLFQSYPYLRTYYNVGDKILRLPAQLGGGSISFGFAENPGDILKFQGQGFMDLLLDEATHLTQGEIDFLRTTRRHTGVADKSCKMVLTCNPGGVGHNYIKRVMVDKIYLDNEIPESFAFIPAYGWDNVEWVRSFLDEIGVSASKYYKWSDAERFACFIQHSEYGRTLNALPETMRIQHLLGRWDYFEGQVFPELCEQHNLDTYMDSSNMSAFASEMRKVSGHDHASTGITAHILTAIDSDENIFVIDEYYAADRLISEHAAAVKSLLGAYGQPDYTVIDPSTEAKTLQNVRDLYSVQDAYMREGLPMLAAVRASIGVGIDLLKEMLKVSDSHRNPFTQAKGSPRLFISRKRCPNLWKEMSELQCENKDGKISYIGTDHATDCLRYIAMSRPRRALVKPADISQLPTVQQKAIRSHAVWAKKWDHAAHPQSGSWF
jgi:phage terminase large subunit